MFLSASKDWVLDIEVSPQVCVLSIALSSLSCKWLIDLPRNPNDEWRVEYSTWIVTVARALYRFQTITTAVVEQTAVVVRLTTHANGLC
jgi:hypothetical protein